jgi:uncharacterized protein YjbJ (UPF0337 family)
MADYKKKNTVGEEAGGFGERVKGDVKEGFGKVTGNERLESEGRAEANEGKARQANNDVLRETPGYDKTTGKSRLVTGLYNRPEDAQRAYSDLTTRHGYKPDDVSVLMSDDTRKRYFDADTRLEGAAPEGEGSKALEGMGVGSALGGTLGAIIGGIAAIGTNVLFPGLGLVVAGPLAAALAGAGAGGATGGLLGALVGAGIPEERAVEYERGLNEGGIVLGTHARDEEHAAQLERDYANYGATNVRR